VNCFYDLNILVISIYHRSTLIIIAQ